MKIVRRSDITEDFYSCESLKKDSKVRKILKDVLSKGDDAIKDYTLKFEGVMVEETRVKRAEIKKAYSVVNKKTISALTTSKENIEKFSKIQLNQFNDFETEIIPGVFVGQRVIPVDRIGIYAPAGKFPLVSSVLMCAIPARVAGVKEIVLCSPPSYNGSIHPAILLGADLCGINEIYRVGGAQAIAAMAFGTETIKKVDKIVGPGSKYVTLAKKEVFGIVGIDFIAGPTEVMIIADETANPMILAADLLAQAEHDTNAISILISNSLSLAEEVNKEIERQLKELKTEVIARQSIDMNGMIVFVEKIDEAIEIANRKAPEHLELQIKNPDIYIDQLRNYGSLFIGEYSAEVLGDYSCGLNHTLPTSGCAHYTGGLNVKDFIKLTTTLKVTRNGFSLISPIAKKLSEVEGMDGHTKSINIRLSESL